MPDDLTHSGATAVNKPAVESKAPIVTEPYTKPTAEQAWHQMLSQIQNEERGVLEEELRVSPEWVMASKVWYEHTQGKPFAGTDHEAVQFGLDTMSNNYAWFNSDTAFSSQENVGLVGFLDQFENAPDHAKMAAGFLHLMYEEKNTTWSGFGRGARANLQDPSNAVGLATVVGLAGKWVGRGVLKEGFNQLVRQNMKRIFGKQGFALSVIEGAGFGASDDAMLQGLERQIGRTMGSEVQPGYDWKRGGMAATAGGILGGTLNQAIPAASMLYRKAKGVSDELKVGFDVSNETIVPPTGPLDMPVEVKVPGPQVGRQGNNYLGAPGSKTPQARQGLIRRMMPILNHEYAEFDRSIDWYESAGRTIDALTRGDPILKEQVVRVLAFYSANSGVDMNTSAAIEAAFSIAKGATPLTGQAPMVSGRRLDAILNAPEFDTDLPGVGNKVMNFYRNLHDPAFGRDDYPDAVTIDRHMLRLMGYTTQQPTDRQYAYAQTAIVDLTNRYNEANGTDLRPRQMQAALWSYQRVNYEVGRGKEPPAYTDFPIEISKATAHIPWEANSPIFPEFATLTPERKIQFTEEARAIVHDENGRDVILNEILQTPLFRHITSSGSFEGVISPNTETAIVLPRFGGMSGDYDTGIAELYANVIGHIYQQDSVPWFRFDYDLAEKYRAFQKNGKAGGEDINLGLAVIVAPEHGTPEFTEALFKHISGEVEGVDFTRFVDPEGNITYSFVNFRDAEGVPYGLKDGDFESKLRAAIDSFDSDVPNDSGLTYNQGRLVEKDEDYMARIVSEGSPDLVARADSWRKEFESLVERYRSEGGTTQGGKATPTPEEVIPTSSETLSPGQLSGSPPDPYAVDVGDGGQKEMEELNQILIRLDKLNPFNEDHAGEIQELQSYRDHLEEYLGLN